MRLLPLLLSFRGRIGRKSWWIGFVIWLAGNLSGALLFNPGFFTAEELPPPSLADTVWQLAWLAPLTAITVKRFNDRNWPSWLAYLFLGLNIFHVVAPHYGLVISPEVPGAGYTAFWAVAIVQLAIVINNGFIRGTDGPNRHGPDPLEPAL